MPCDYKKYPANWKQIRASILERAGHKCERCGLPNYSLILRHKDGRHWPPNGWNPATVGGDHASDWIPDEFEHIEKLSKVVLTCAHINDPDPMNCADDNLQMLCQGCHNKLDAPMRAKNAAATRRQKREQAGQLNMLEVLSDD